MITRFAGKLKLHGSLVTPGQPWSSGQASTGQPICLVDAQWPRHEWGHDRFDDEEVLSPWVGLVRA
jgi:hypothetical protein